MEDDRYGRFTSPRIPTNRADRRRVDLRSSRSSEAPSPPRKADEGRDLPVEFVHNNLEDAPVAGAVWAAGPALKNGDAICSTAADERRERQRQLRGHRSPQRDLDRGQPHRPRQPDLRRQRLPAGDQPGRPRDGLDALARDRVVRRRPELDGVPDPHDVDLPGHGRPGRRLRRRRQRVLRDARLPVRRAGQRPEPGHPRLGVQGRRRDLGCRIAWPRAAATARPSATCSTRSTSTAWGDGNALVTFGDFRLGHKGALESGRIYATVTHDAGATWTTPVLVSGDALFAFVSTPIATADGRIFVAYEDFTALRQRPRRLRGRRARSRHRRPDRRAVQGRHPDRRRHRLPDRARPPDLPGLDLPFLVRRQHRGRSRPTATTSRSSGRTCATARCPPRRTRTRR